MSPRRRLSPVAGVLLAGLLGCPKPAVEPAAGGALTVRPDVSPSSIASVSERLQLPSDRPVVDPASGCTLPVPPGWSAYRLPADEDLIVELVRLTPPAMRIEVHRGHEHQPNGEEPFFDRGRYLGAPRDDVIVGVWADRDGGDPALRRFGVSMEHDGDAIVVLGWVPESDFEAAKRAFDAVVESITWAG